MLPNDSLLLQEYVLLQEGESRMLQRKTCQARMLLQKGHVPDAEQVRRGLWASCRATCDFPREPHVNKSNSD